MFSEKINTILNNDYIKLLLEEERINPQSFRESFQSNVEGDSLFIAFLKKENNLNFVENLLEMGIRNGYSLKNKTKVQSKDFKYIKNNNSEILIPDIIYALSLVNSKVGLYLLKTLDNNYILDLEKEGWPLFKFACKRKQIEVARYLMEIGCDVTLTESDKDKTLDYAQENPEILEIYWDGVKKNNKDEVIPQEFEHMKEHLSKKIDRMYGSKITDMESFKKTITEKKERLKEEQKFDLLKITLACKDKRLFKELVKDFGYKFKEEKIQDFLLKNLRNANQMEYTYLFLNQKSLSKKIGYRKVNDEIKEVYGINEVSNMLSSNSVKLDSDEGSWKYLKEKYKMAIKNRLKEDFSNKGYNVLFEKISESDKNLFEIILGSNEQSFECDSLLEIVNIGSEKRKSILTFKHPDLNKEKEFKVENLSEEARIEIRDIYEKTWFKKTDGKLLITRYNASIIANKYKFDLLKSDNLMEFSTKEEKLEMLKWLVNENNFENMVKYKTSGLFDKLYDYFKHDESFDWNNIDIDEKYLEKVKDKEFYFEFKALKMNAELKSQLKNVDTKELKKSFKL